MSGKKKDDGAKVTGGAIEQEVEVEAVETNDTPGETISVVTTAPGTMSNRGVVPVGTKAQVSLEAYSENWMRPVDAKEAKKLTKLTEAQEASDP